MEKEIERCTALKATAGDEDLEWNYEDRVDVLQFAKESIEADIGNEMLTA